MVHVDGPLYKCVLGSDPNEDARIGACDGTYAI